MEKSKHDQADILRARISAYTKDLLIISEMLSLIIANERVDSTSDFRIECLTLDLFYNIDQSNVKVLLKEHKIKTEKMISELKKQYEEL
jgi:hypothetical protein